MKLHRTTGKPDWANMNLSDMNNWQRLARKSQGVITPGNIVSILGLGLVLYGLWCVTGHNYKSGLIFLIVGRFADLVDGYLAEKTQTKSPLGEIIDAGIDKLGTLLTFIVLYAAHTAPWLILSLLLLPQIINSLFSVWAYKNNNRLHPSPIGKLSMAALLLSIAGLLLLKAFYFTRLETISIDVVAVASAILGLVSSYGYARKSLK